MRVLKFFCVFLFISAAENSFARDKLTDTEEYRNILKQYVKVLFEEACYSTNEGGCIGSSKENLLSIQFNLSTVGEYYFNNTTYYYVVMPFKSGGTAYAMLSRKSAGDRLNLCGLVESIEPFDEVVKKIRSKDESICDITLDE